MKYRVAAVSYVNTLPLLHGLQSSELQEHIDVLLAHPAKCADLLLNGEVDIALCPVGALPGLKDYQVISDYCIGCDGPVRTVSVYSNRPLDQCRQVVLSAESRTSNLLVQILNKEYWKYDIEFVPPSQGDKKTADDFAYLFIGDICFQKEREFSHRTDLGQSWKDWTDLPFAFACWVSTKDVASDVVVQMNKAFRTGIGRIDALYFPTGMNEQLLKNYLKENINYDLDQGKRTAMTQYLSLINQLTG